MSIVHENRVQQRYGLNAHGPSQITTWDVDVEAEAADASATYLTVQSEWPISGEILACDIQPYTALAANTVVSIYESDSFLSTARTPVSLTQAGANAAATVYPVVQKTDKTGSAVASQYGLYPVAGYLTLKLSTNFVASNRVRVRLYVNTGGA